MLTKSNYILGLQCPKLLWISKNQKERIPEPDFAAKHKLEVGSVVGVLATKVFPGGVDLSELDFNENIAKTKEAVEKKQIIYEAGLWLITCFPEEIFCFLLERMDGI